MVHRRSAFLLTFLVLSGKLFAADGAALNSPPPPPRFEEPLSVRDVGEYGGVPWGKPGTKFDPGSRMDRVRDLNLAISSVNLNWLLDDDGNLSPGGLADWAQTARWGREQGKKLLPRVYFWDGNDRFKGAMRDVEVYWKRLDAYLSTTNPADLYGVCLAEENIWHSGRASVLAELYHRIKEKYHIEVWQWWSPYSDSPDSGGWVPADGWIIDHYWVGRKPFRRQIRKYLISGKPLIVMPGITANKDVPTPAAERRATLEQLEVAVEFNLPVAFYWIYGPSAGFGGARGSMVNTLDRINHVVWDYIRRVRQIPPAYTGLPSADVGHGDILKLAPSEGAERLVYTDDFSEIRCVDGAFRMTGFRDYVMDGKTLALRGFLGRSVDASLVYRFAGEFRAHFPSVSLKAMSSERLNGRVTLAVSLDGKSWLHEVQLKSGDALELTTNGDRRFQSCNQFWVRVAMRGDAGMDADPVVQIDDLRIEADLLAPSEKVVQLQPRDRSTAEFVWREDFATNQFVWRAQITHEEHIEWQPGSLSVRMRPGGSHPVLVWKLRADEPLANIGIAVDCSANHFLSTDHYLDVSTDGKTWVHEVSTEAMTLRKRASGLVNDGLRVDLSNVPEFHRIKEFYIRLRPWAGSTVRSGKHRVHPYASGIVDRIEVTATGGR